MSLVWTLDPGAAAGRYEAAGGGSQAVNVAQAVFTSADILAGALKLLIAAPAANEYIYGFTNTSYLRFGTTPYVVPGMNPPQFGCGIIGSGGKWNDADAYNPLGTPVAGVFDQSTDMLDSNVIGGEEQPLDAITLVGKAWHVGFDDQGGGPLTDGDSTYTFQAVYIVVKAFPA